MAALGLLQQIFQKEQNPNPVWSDLVDSVSRQVYDERMLRGAGEKPVLRRYDPNKQPINGPSLSHLLSNTPQNPQSRGNEVECIDILSD